MCTVRSRSSISYVMRRSPSLRIQKLESPSRPLMSGRGWVASARTAAVTSLTSVGSTFAGGSTPGGPRCARRRCRPCAATGADLLPEGSDLARRQALVGACVQCGGHRVVGGIVDDEHGLDHVVR